MTRNRQAIEYDVQPKRSLAAAKSVLGRYLRYVDTIMVRIVVAMLGLAAIGSAHAQDTNDSGLMFGCGSLANSYGPFDYNNPQHRAEKLPIVDKAHFTPQVESLTRGQSGSLVRDLDYTLRAFPNHSRALWAMARYHLSLQRRSEKSDSPYSIDCYFDRALHWRPNDANVWLIHGMYLAKKGELDEALAKYEMALKLEPESAEINYNAGLAYFDRRDYARARGLAEKAYALGYPLPGLKNKLAEVGQWPRPSDAGH